MRIMGYIGLIDLAAPLRTATIQLMYLGNLYLNLCRPLIPQSIGVPRE